MTRIRFDFGTLTLDAELLDTPTARAIAAALPISSSALTWGEEVYFEMPVKVAREKDARAVVTPGRDRLLAGWPRIALGFGRTPISRGDETRLASPCNIFARALGDVKALAKVRAGTKVSVTGSGSAARSGKRARPLSRPCCGRRRTATLTRARRTASGSPSPS